MGNNPWSRVDPYGEYGANPWHSAYLEDEWDRRQPERAEAARERRELVDSGRAGPMLELDDSIANSLADLFTLGFYGESPLAQAKRYDNGGYLYEATLTAEVVGVVAGGAEIVIKIGPKLVRFGAKGIGYLFRKNADNVAKEVTDLARINPEFARELEGGGSWLMTKKMYREFVEGAEMVGRPDGQFMTSARRMNHLIVDAGGDSARLGKALGVEGWDSGTDLIRIDVLDPLHFNPRLPSAGMSGANSLFKPGGLTPGGIPEVVTAPIPAINIWATKVK